MTLNFELDTLKERLKEFNPKKVLIQLPEGIKQNAFEIKKKFEDLKIEVVFSGDTCWGGCSINPEEAKSAGCDMIVHFGHAKFINSNFPILYVEVRDELNLNPILDKSLKSIKKYKTLGLSYSIQHRHDIDSVIKFYESHGKKVILSEKKGYSAYEGHVVGCEFNGLKSIQEKVDAFLILGNNFHSMGAVISVTKPVILIDVYNDSVTEMSGERDKIIRQRLISIEKFKKAKRVGVIVESKIGQKFGSPKFLMDKLKESGKDAILITMSEITPDKLMNFYNIEAFIELACPRIAIDDFSKYPRTIITLKEALVGLGEKKTEELLEKGFW